MVPSDTELQRMTDAELAALWAKRPQWPVSAGDMEFVRLAVEMRYRSRHRTKHDTLVKGP